jgi:hypothetical protein
VGPPPPPARPAGPGAAASRAHRRYGACPQMESVRAWMERVPRACRLYGSPQPFCAPASSSPFHHSLQTARPRPAVGAASAQLPAPSAGRRLQRLALRRGGGARPPVPQSPAQRRASCQQLQKQRVAARASLYCAAYFFSCEPQPGRRARPPPPRTPTHLELTRPPPPGARLLGGTWPLPPALCTAGLPRPAPGPTHPPAVGCAPGPCRVVCALQCVWLVHCLFAFPTEPVFCSPGRVHTLHCMSLHTPTRAPSVQAGHSARAVLGTHPPSPACCPRRPAPLTQRRLTAGVPASAYDTRWPKPTCRLHMHRPPYLCCYSHFVCGRRGAAQGEALSCWAHLRPRQHWRARRPTQSSPRPAPPLPCLLFDLALSIEGVGGPIPQRARSIARGRAACGLHRRSDFGGPFLAL